MVIQKILVVDDSPTERYFYADLLTRSGYTVVTAENGEEAMLKARTVSRSRVPSAAILRPSIFRSSSAPARIRRLTATGE